jgi:hypothetical protein
MFHTEHLEQENRMNIQEWIAYGIEQRFCSAVVCATHDGLPWTQQEEDDFNAGVLDDPCVYGVRINEPETE